MKRCMLLLLVVVTLLPGCQNNPVVPEATQVVLQAYLYEGQPVTDIAVMLSRALSNSDTANTPVPNAAVSLSRNGVQYQLSPSTQTSGTYYYAGTDLQVQSGDQFAIQVTYGGTTANAQTVVPGKPVGIALNTSTIVFTVDTVTTPSGRVREVLTSADSVTLSWINPSQLQHYVVVESIDSTRQPLRADTLGNVTFARRFVAEPTTDNTYRIPQSSFNYTGRYRITLYRVNQEYVDLFASRQQDSRNLKEPTTNVRNGLGIFTAFASDSTFVAVELQ